MKRLSGLLRALTGEGQSSDDSTGQNGTPQRPKLCLFGSFKHPDDGRQQPLAFEFEKLKSHVHVMGATQHGKSVHMASLLLQKIGAGEQVIAFDPHGPIYNYMLRKMVETGAFDDPSIREKVLFVNLPYAHYRRLYASFDPLGEGIPEQMYTAALQILDALHRAWPELDQASAFDSLVPNSAAVLAYHRLPLTMIDELIYRADLRERLVNAVPDRKIRSYFKNHFNQLGAHLQARESGSTLRRITRLNFSPELRYSLESQEPYNLARMQTALENGTSLIFNLHFEDDETIRFWLALLLSSVENAVKRHLGKLETPLDLNVAADEIGMALMKEHSEVSFNNILQRTAGAGVSMWVCHQNMSSLPDSMRGALANCGTRIYFNLSEDDADYAEPYFFSVDPWKVKETTHIQGMPRFTYLSSDDQRTIHRQQFIKLQKREALVKLPNGLKAKIRTPDLPKPDVDERLLEEVETYYLDQLFRHKSVIEADLQQRLEKAGIADLLLHDEANSNPPANRPKSNKPTQRATEQPPSPESRAAPSTDVTQESNATINANAFPTTPAADPSAQPKPFKDEDDQSAFKASPRRRK